jgi:hypothetical protein
VFALRIGTVKNSKNFLRVDGPARPRAWEFCERFCSHKVSMVKEDGKDISVVRRVRSELISPKLGLSGVIRRSFSVSLQTRMVNSSTLSSG